MTVRARVLIAFAAVAVPVLLAPLLLRPVYAIALVCAAAVVALAFRSIAYPVGLAGVPAVAIGLSGGTNPFPPGTIALFGAAWAAIAIFATVARSDDELPFRVLLAAPVIASVLLTVWLLVRLGSSLDPAYGSRKLQLFVASNVVSLVAGILIARRRSRFELYVFVALVMAGLSSLALARGLLAGQHANVGGRFSITADDSPIGLGRDAARGILFAVFVLLASKATWLRVLAFGALPLVVVALLASGSRGPLVGLVVGLVTLLLLTLGDRAARGRLLLVLGGILLAVFLVPQLVPGQNASRALSIFSGRSEGLSSNGRTHLWHEAWQLFTANPLLGIGTGSFGHFEPIELFPHNIFLETAVELGLVGFLLTITVIVSTGLLGWRAWRSSVGDDRAHASVVLALFASGVVNACLSSDITSNDALWLASGLAVGISRRLDLALAEPFLAMRALRRSRKTRERPVVGRGPIWPQERQPAGVQAPRIVEPVAGASVSGLVPVQVTASRTGRPLALVRIEWSTGGEWSQVAERDERTYDVGVGTEMAVVRSQWLADLFAAALGAQAEQSRRRPWAAPSVYTVEWDSALVPPGAGSIRAVTVDAEGREIRSDEVVLTVVAGVASAAPEDDERAKIIRRIRDARAAAGRLTAREAELEQREAAAARERASIAARAKVVEALRAGVDTERASIAELRAAVETGRAEVEAGTAALVATRQELAAREATLAEREIAIERAAADLERGRIASAEARDQAEELRKKVEVQSADLAERERKLAASATATEQERRALADRERELQERAAQLETRIASTAARAEQLAAERAELERLQAEVESDRSEVAALQAELKNGNEALAEEQRLLSEREARLGSSVSEREAELTRRAEELATAQALVASLQGELASERTELGTRERKVTEQQARLAEQEQELEAGRAEVTLAREAAAAARAEVESLRAELAEREKHLGATAAEREAALASRTEELDRLRAEADAARTEVEALRESLESGQSELERQASELAEREARLGSTIGEREAELDRRAGELQAERERIVSAQAELAAERAELASREREIAERAARLAPVVRLHPPGGPVRGEVELDVELENVRGAVGYEVAVPDGWRTVAAAGRALDTSALPDGRSRVRAVADGATSEPVEVLVDNEPPRVRIVEPAQGSTVSGTVVPVVEATDDATSVHSVLLQRSRDGSSWRPVVGQSWDTATDEDGEWMLRATAVDDARNVGRSEVVRLVVRNAVPDPVAPPAPPSGSYGAPVGIPRIAAARPTLFDLEAAVASLSDPFRRDELDAILFYLRDYADVDGALPAQFDALVEQEFGELARLA